MVGGITPVLPTPFHADGSIDVAAMRRVIDFALRSGASGVAFPGFASEVTDLTADERAALLRTVFASVGGAVPIVAGASGNSVEEILIHGREALEVGVTNLMIQAPRSVGAQAGEVIAFFSAVADALPDATLMLQNAPPPRGMELSAETTRMVVAAVPSVRYVKLESLPSGPQISELLHNPPPNLEGVLGGGGARYLFDEYRRGACGTMPAIELVDLHVAFDAAYRAGDLELARQLYIDSLPLLTLQSIYRMRLTKRVLMLRGVLDNDITRTPMPAFDPDGIKEVGMWLEALAPRLGVARAVGDARVRA